MRLNTCLEGGTIFRRSVLSQSSRSERMFDSGWAAADFECLGSAVDVFGASMLQYAVHKL